VVVFRHKVELVLFVGWLLNQLQTEITARNQMFGHLELLVWGPVRYLLVVSLDRFLYGVEPKPYLEVEVGNFHFLSTEVKGEALQPNRRTSCPALQEVASPHYAGVKNRKVGSLT
jgi:hypothetical protein